MKSAMAIAMTLLFCAAWPLEATAARSSTDLNPVTRVVQLLQELSKKLYADGKAEEDLYERFVCWAESIINAKTASNAAAQSRIDELEAYIADVKAGKIEFTSERVSLEQAVVSLQSDIDASEAQRKKEKADYQAAKDEIEKAVKALQKALKVLQAATSLSQTSSLISLRQQLRENSAQKAEDAAALDEAIRLGKNFLAKGDAEFLQRLLTGDVPAVDWKKLNRKAVFKMKYKARSFKIQDVLVNLLKTFDANLIALDAKEVKAEELFIKLSVSMKGQLETAQTGLQEMSAEGAAQGQTEEGAQEEVDALKVQVDTDTQFIKQTQAALADKKIEWAHRKKLRAEELAAISKAIAILNSDEARDQMQKSFASQGYLLLQQGSGTSAAVWQHVVDAGAVIRATAAKVGDQRLLALMWQTALQGGGHFDKVIEAIDKMLAELDSEKKEDVLKKEDCEKRRSEKARAVTLESRNIDDITDKVRKLIAEAKELQAEIEEKKKAKRALEEEIKPATELRESQHAEWAKNDQADKAATLLIEEAIKVLHAFYSANGLVLAQAQSQAPPVEAGEAPPPPPATWEAPYTPHEGGTGIIAILSMILDDVHKDKEAAVAAEDKANQEYQTFVKDTHTAIHEIEGAITELEAKRSEKVAEVGAEQKTRLAAKKSLDAIMKTLQDLAPNCDFYQVNFQGRAMNRAIEIDGLSKAKAILQGAAFGPPPQA